MDIEVTARNLHERLTSAGTRPARLIVWSDDTVSEELVEDGGRYVVAQFSSSTPPTTGEIIRELINGLSRHVEVEPT